MAALYLSFEFSVFYSDVSPGAADDADTSISRDTTTVTGFFALCFMTSQLPWRRIFSQQPHCSIIYFLLRHNHRFAYRTCQQLVTPACRHCSVAPACSDEYNCRGWVGIAILFTDFSQQFAAAVARCNKCVAIITMYLFIMAIVSQFYSTLCPDNCW